MIDNASILFSTVMVLVVIFRAIRLDSSRPWFKPGRSDAGGAGPRRPWQR